jgi:hypothetical protein
VQPLAAQEIVIDAFDVGLLCHGTSGGQAFSGADEVGCSPTCRTNNFVKFDLSGVTQEIESAQFVLEFPSDGYDSRSHCRILELHEVTSDPGTFGIREDGGTRPFRLRVFVDLQDGVCYGSRRFYWGAGGTVTTINLNADAVAAINAARGGVFSIGGTDGGGTPTFPSCTHTIFRWNWDLHPDGLDIRYGLPYTRQLILWPR